MNKDILFEPYLLADIELKNKIVMAPMTRSRAIGNVPNSLMAEYYSQRSGAGLIVTEGVSPSPDGLGYSRIPGLYSKEQTNAWKLVTAAVHAKGSRIFAQLMHTGRISTRHNLPEGARTVAPSAVQAPDKIWCDAAGMVEHDVPEAMSLEMLFHARGEYVKAAVNAIEARFDGIELHGANGYLLEQFLSPHTNQRTDNYGGSVQNRTRFLLEVIDETITAIGKNKIGIRFSPYGAGGGMKPYDEIEETYEFLANELNKRGIAYIHLVDHSAMGAPAVPQSVKDKIRNNFSGTLISAGGFNVDSAVELVSGKGADLVAFGKPFINNPDLVERLRNDWPLSDKLDFKTFYTSDSVGYTDYPNYQA